MRSVAIAAVLVVLVAACGGDGPQMSSESASDTTCVPPPSVDDETIVRMILTDDDVPADIAVLGEPTVARGVKCTSSDSTATAARQYDSPDPFPPYGAQRVIVTASVHSSASGAEQEIDWASDDVSQGNIARLLQPDWHLLSFEDLSDFEPGEQRKVVHYVAANAEGLVFLETYWANFRRDNLTAVLNIRAPLGNISEEQFKSLAAKLDRRTQEGLRSLR